MSDTQRVVMMWPTELKEKVREVAGKGGITEFTIKAVSVHLGVDGDLSEVEKQVNEVKYFAQQLADQLVLGGDREDRLQALMEVQFPDWIDTSGWPPAFADRVRPEEPVGVEPELEPEPAAEPEVPEVVQVAEVVPPNPIPQELVEKEEEPELSAPEAPVVSGDRDDLFARVMAKTGGTLSDVPGLKVASEIPKPPPVEQKDLCPACGEERVDGECWTC